jgi:purine-binding chemotaxis protein CheW
MSDLQSDSNSIQENRGVEYLTFRLGDEDYGVDILRVREIRGWENVTRIPNSPVYVKGVLNLRGSIVPIFDMRQRLGMETRDYSKDTVVIVLRVKGANNERNIGVVVDEVSDVLNAQQSSIRNTPQFGGGVPTEYISGLVDVTQGSVSVAGGQGRAGATVTQGSTSVPYRDVQMSQAHGAQERPAGGQGRAGAAAEGKMVMLLDVDKLLNQDTETEQNSEDAA